MRRLQSPEGLIPHVPYASFTNAPQKKCLHQDTWKLIQEKQAATEYKKVLKKHGIENRRQIKELKRKATVARQREDAAKSVTPVSTEQETGECIVLRALPTLVPIQPAPPKLAKAPTPVNVAPKVPVREPVKEPVKEPVEKAAEPIEEPIKETANKPVKVPVLEKADDEGNKEVTEKEAQEPVKEAPPVAPSVRATRPIKNASPPRPSSRSKRSSNVISPSNDVARLDLDLSILAEEQAYTSIKDGVEPVLDPSITAPPIDIDDTPPKARKAQQPRTMPDESSPTSPSASPSVAQNDIQREYIAALHQRAKVTYANSNRSIKRKAEEESPEQATAATSSGRRVKKEVVVGDGKTTFENLRQLSLGLRVRGQRGGEVC